MNARRLAGVVVLSVLWSLVCVGLGVGMERAVRQSAVVEIPLDDSGRGDGVTVR